MLEGKVSEFNEQLTKAVLNRWIKKHRQKKEEARDNMLRLLGYMYDVSEEIRAGENPQLETNIEALEAALNQLPYLSFPRTIRVLSPYPHTIIVSRPIVIQSLMGAYTTVYEYVKGTEGARPALNHKTA